MSSNPFLTAALTAADRGWAVFPIIPGGKIPAIKQWEQRATTDQHQIHRWWADNPAHNIGIACQPSGLVVLDLDAGHGHPPPQWARLGVTHGRDVLRILAQRADRPDPSGTYTVATPSHGEHRYFLAPPEVQLRNTCAALGWCVDTRAAGGAIIAAGSVRHLAVTLHPYRVVQDLDPITLPEWLLTALTPAPIPAQAPILLASTRRLTAYAQAALKGESTAVAQAAPGTRAHTLFRSAARLGQLIGAGALDETVAFEALLTAAPISTSGSDRFTHH